jgi:hypothetical protein
MRARYEGAPKSRRNQWNFSFDVSLPHLMWIIVIILIAVLDASPYASDASISGFLFGGGLNGPFQS